MFMTTQILFLYVARPYWRKTNLLCTSQTTPKVIWAILSVLVDMYYKAAVTNNVPQWHGFKIKAELQ